MDTFQSVVTHVPQEELATLGDITDRNMAFDNTEKIVFDAGVLGWGDGGLERIFRKGGGIVRTEPLYFRGAAMFDNIDDAKNDYLMAPEQECFNVDGEVVEDCAHTPFGMVIPQVRSKLDRGVGYYTILTSATIILWWQEL